jgi:hypothetical protein
MHLQRVRSLVLLTPFFVVAVQSGAAAQTQVAVPVVKCPLETMTGPESVSGPATVNVRTSKAWAAQIAFYSIGSIGALGPRGWHCQGHSGSSGATILVAPGAVPGLGDSLRGRIGMQIAYYSGSTSGRSSVFEIGAPLFADLRALAPKAPATFGITVPRTQPIRGETLKRLSTTVVTFVDPPKLQGSGPGSGGAYPTYGVIVEDWKSPAKQSGTPLPDLRLISITAPAKDASLMQELSVLNSSS